MRVQLIGLALLCGLLLAGCMGEQEQAIQGIWEYNEEHLKSIASEQHLTVVWYFGNGSFRYQACCFNVDEELSGQYRILDVSGDIIDLQLYNLDNASARVNPEIRIRIDAEEGTLNIQGAGPYRKVSP